MKVSEYLTEPSPISNQAERYGRNQEWLTYINRAMHEISDYLDEKVIDYEWYGPSPIDEGSQGLLCITRFPHVRYYREVVKPGLLNIARKWNARVQIGVRAHPKTEAPMLLVRFIWFTEEVDAEVIK